MPKAPEDYSSKTDNELVLLALEDQAFFAGIMNRYSDKLARYIRRISNFGEEEVEDVLQDIFIKVYKNLNDFDNDLKFSSWIYRITHNQVISHHRAKSARPQTVEIDDFLANRLRAEIDLTAEIEGKDLKKEVATMLSVLKPIHREILVLRFFEEKSYEEISDILKKPNGSVATLIYSAKKELKEKYARS
ncbi:MAG: RNA polymerase sigma factor [Candidatus Falkowbacteria bacterium]|nr:RNA polymerase sigma factor [Candidatus Falkowbacteria bacterium]